MLLLNIPLLTCLFRCLVVLFVHCDICYAFQVSLHSAILQQHQPRGEQPHRSIHKANRHSFRAATHARFPTVFQQLQYRLHHLQSINSRTYLSAEGATAASISSVVANGELLAQGVFAFSDDPESNARTRADNMHQVNDNDDQMKEEQPITSSSTTTTTATTTTTTISSGSRGSQKMKRVKFTSSGEGSSKLCMLGLEKISYSVGANTILSDASFRVSTGEKIGLVGPNGAGKSTILRILAGELEAADGEIIKSSQELRVAYLKQEFIEHLHPDFTLREELLSSFVEENECLRQISEVERQLGNETLISDSNAMEALIDRLNDLVSKAKRLGAMSLDSKVDRIRSMMGFVSSDDNLLVSSFSGGWKMRISLAKLLMHTP